jgi:hypothetical protein
VADVEIPAAAFECWPRAGEVLAHLDEAICLRRRSSAMLGRLPALVAAQAGLRKNGWTALDQVAEVTAGVTQSGSPFGETPMLRPGDLANGSVAVGVLSFVPDGATHVTALREGDILIVRRGSDGVRGRSAIYEGEPPAAAFNPNLAAIRCERLPAELLWAWLQTDEARTALDREARGTKAPVWSIAALKELLVPWFESSEVPARAAQVIRSLRLAMPVASSQQALIGSVVQAYLGRIFAGSVVAAARPDEQPSMTEAIPEALLGVFLRASPDQRQVWQRVAGTAGSFRVADLVESDRERAHLQHTLSLLEQLGIVISERDSLIDRWRVPDPDEDLIG